MKMDHLVSHAREHIPILTVHSLIGVAACDVTTTAANRAAVFTDDVMVGSLGGRKVGDREYTMIAKCIYWILKH